MAHVKAIHRGFCGQKLREVGEEFEHPGQIYTWMQVLDADEPEKKPAEPKQKSSAKSHKPSQADDVI